MRICDNGIYRDMTAEEERAYHESISASNGSEEDKLTMLEKQVNENAEQITATQEALCELYETVI